uniref:Alpha-MPP n=1 Tax=Biomphalaria glabrata TaxID=6526 RepID=A0A2C9LIU9_BIOGL
NGMQVCVLSDKSLPIVSHVLIYKVGSSDEPVGLSGMAHVLEHMMFKSTINHDENYYINQLRKIGAAFNATTTELFTSYYATAPKQYLNLVAELESNRMKNLAIKDDEFKKELQVVIAEKKMRLDNIEFAKAYEVVRNVQFPNYPFGHLAIGWIDDLNNIKTSDLEDFYKSYYRPSNAILVLSGDITKSEAEQLVKKYYSSKDLETVSLNRMYKADIVNDAKIYINKRSGQLYEYIVKDKKLAADIYSELNIRTINSSEFIIDSSVSQNISTEDLSKHLDVFLNKIADSGLKKEHVEMAKNYIKINQVYMHENLEDLATHYAVFLALGLPVDFIKNYGDLVSSISVTDVNNMLKKLAVSNFVECHLKMQG